MGGLYLSFLWSPVGTGLTEIRVEMEFWDWLEANEDVSRLSGDMGGVMRLGLLHSECDRDPNTQRHTVNTTSLLTFEKSWSTKKTNLIIIFHLLHENLAVTAINKEVWILWNVNKALFKRPLICVEMHTSVRAQHWAWIPRCGRDFYPFCAILHIARWTCKACRTTQAHATLWMKMHELCPKTTQMVKNERKAKWRLTKSGTGRQWVGAMRGLAAAGGLRELSRTLLAKVQTQTPLMLWTETQTQRQMESEREREHKQACERERKSHRARKNKRVKCEQVVSALRAAQDQ